MNKRFRNRKSKKLQKGVWVPLASISKYGQSPLLATRQSGGRAPSLETPPARNRRFRLESALWKLPCNEPHRSAMRRKGAAHV